MDALERKRTNYHADEDPSPRLKDDALWSVEQYSTSPAELIRELVARGIDPEKCHFEVGDFYGDATIEIYGERLETEDEALSRVYAAKNARENKEQHDREEFARLSTKFADKTKE